METGLHDHTHTIHFLFKSYYVVWKLSPPSSLPGSQLSFKSYYVVWKLPTCMIFSDISFEFKSYYVVWKRFFRLFSPVLPGCLNRTM